MSADLKVTAAELRHRTILRADLVPDKAAFLDTKIPGSDRKVNYPLIGPGVSENAAQAVPVTEPHGFNLGGAVMPAGVTNSLHLHFTAEVFVCFAGQWQFRWGVNGDEGEALVQAGDVISIPTWMFRGFTSLTDDAWLFTALGREESGGLIWAPSVIKEAAKYGMFLGADGKLIETRPGSVPEGVALVAPLSDEDIAALRTVSVEQMRERLARPDDLAWSSRAFLDSTLPGGGAELALVVGYGLTEDRLQAPRLTEPHGLSLAWLRAQPGRGVSFHRHDEPQVLIADKGRWRVTLNREEPVTVELGPYDTLSIPPGAWRRFESIGDEPATTVVITANDARVYVEWDEAVVTAARDQDIARDANGYLAPAHLVAR